jgi:raffinose/stachyose/melibiose transport system permease protein
MRTRLKKVSWGRGIFIYLMLFLFLVPFYIIVNNSFKTTEQFITSPFALASAISFRNYVYAFERMNYVNAISNSADITLLSVVGIILTSSMAAYFLVRFHWKINKIIFAIMVASMIVPFQAIMIPLVTIYGSLNALNNKWILIFMYLGFGQSFAVFICHGFIKNIPLELEEAALIDGCNRVQSYFKVVLPNLLPIIVTLMILDVLWIWNDYLLPSMILLSPLQRTLPLSTYSFFSTYSVDFTPLMASLVMTILPVIILYILGQKQIVKGVVQGAIK